VPDFPYHRFPIVRMTREAFFSLPWGNLVFDGVGIIFGGWTIAGGEPTDLRGTLLWDMVDTSECPWVRDEVTAGVDAGELGTTINAIFPDDRDGVITVYGVALDFSAPFPGVGIVRADFRRLLTETRDQV